MSKIDSALYFSGCLVAIVLLAFVSFLLSQKIHCNAKRFGEYFADFALIAKSKLTQNVCNLLICWLNSLSRHDNKCMTFRHTPIYHNLRVL